MIFSQFASSSADFNRALMSSLSSSADFNRAQMSSLRRIFLACSFSPSSASTWTRSYAHHPASFSALPSEPCTTDCRAPCVLPACSLRAPCVLPACSLCIRQHWFYHLHMHPAVAMVSCTMRCATTDSPFRFSTTTYLAAGSRNLARQWLVHE